MSQLGSVDICVQSATAELTRLNLCLTVHVPKLESLCDALQGGAQSDATGQLSLPVSVNVEGLDVTILEGGFYQWGSLSMEGASTIPPVGRGGHPCGVSHTQCCTALWRLVLEFVFTRAQILPLGRPHDLCTLCVFGPDDVSIPCSSI